MCYDLFVTGEPAWPVGIAASYRPGVPVFEFQQEQGVFPFYKMSSPAVRTTRPAVRWVPELFRGPG
jgi:hypothetical protein